MAHNEEHATATGFLNSVFQISSILGALAGGFIIDATGDLAAPMWLAAGMAIIGLILYYPLRKNRLAKRVANAVS
ncbi:MAG TPA: hypothetical protein DCY35_10540 [Prolixibacteraceae bacterium]|nr:hypothetical protein [Prolixibacteraceae bacterium]